jgi:hypothetical protein
MKIRFVRIAGQRDRIYVTRSNGTELGWDFPTLGAEIPHDMMHLVVETAFGLRNGFWGRVDSGVDPKKVNEMANRQGGPNKYAGFGDDLSELYLAESLAGLSWQVREMTPADRYAQFLTNCERQSVQPPDDVTADSLAAVEHRINELRVQWRDLLPKGTMELTFA